MFNIIAQFFTSFLTMLDNSTLMGYSVLTLFIGCCVLGIVINFVMGVNK